MDIDCILQSPFLKHNLHQLFDNGWPFCRESINKSEALKIILSKHFNCIPTSYKETVKQNVHVVLNRFTGVQLTGESVRPIDTLSNKHISLIADQIDEGNLSKIAIQYFDFSFSELHAKTESWVQYDSWFRKCGIIEAWRDKDPTEHHVAVSTIIYKNTGFQFLPSIQLFERNSSLKIHIRLHFVHILSLRTSEIGIFTVQSG